MKSNGFIKLLAVVPLIVLSCSKANIVSEEVTDPVMEMDPWALQEAGPIVFVSGDKSVTASYGEETKSQISMNPGGTYASVVWSAGDSFGMFGFDGNNSFTETTYSTTEGGSSASFTGGAVLTGSSFSSIYPAAAILARSVHSSGKPMFGIRIPNDQTATANGVSPGANLSFCITLKKVDC
jgi:hypothetical protein